MRSLGFDQRTLSIGDAEDCTIKPAYECLWKQAAGRERAGEQGESICNRRDITFVMSLVTSHEPMAKMSRWGGSRTGPAGTLFSRYCFAQASAGVDQGFQQQPGAQGRRWVHWLVPDVHSARSYDPVRFKRVMGEV